MEKISDLVIQSFAKRAYFSFIQVNNLFGSKTPEQGTSTIFQSAATFSKR
jgi:hypothetical protein